MSTNIQSHSSKAHIVHLTYVVKSFHLYFTNLSPDSFNIRPCHGIKLRFSCRKNKKKTLLLNSGVLFFFFNWNFVLVHTGYRLSPIGKTEIESILTNLHT